MAKKIVFIMNGDGTATREDWPGMLFRDCPDCGSKMGQRCRDDGSRNWECWGGPCLKRDMEGVAGMSFVVHPCNYSNAVVQTQPNRIGG